MRCESLHLFWRRLQSVLLRQEQQHALLLRLLQPFALHEGLQKHEEGTLVYSVALPHSREALGLRKIGQLYPKIAIGAIWLVFSQLLPASLGVRGFRYVRIRDRTEVGSRPVQDSQVQLPGAQLSAWTR